MMRPNQRSRRGLKALLKRWWMVPVVLLLAVAAVRGSGARQEKASAYWVEVERRDLDLEAPFTGSVRAMRVAEYGPPTLGNVWDFRIVYMAREGSEVAAGEPVLRFDTSELEQELRVHLADRDAAQKELEERQKDFESQLKEQELAIEEALAQERRAQITANVPEDLVARTTLAKAAADLRLARDEVAHGKERMEFLKRRSRTELGVLRDRRDRAVAALAETERAIELLTVRATSAGLVLYRADRKGQRKKVGDASWRGDRILEIPEPGAMRVQAWVQEADSGGLRVGLPAQVRLEADPERGVLPARVASVQQTVERRRDLGEGAIVRIELTLAETDLAMLRPGMRVQGTILVEERDSRLAVPSAAVAAGPSGPVVSRRTLFGAATRPVELGSRSKGWVEVVHGLADGDEIRVSR
jgi:HlyD family secretion protein